MLADFEYKFSQHDQTIRRAESKARLLAALVPSRSDQEADRSVSRVATILRRLAGSPSNA
jgi:hypothetical protein